MTIYLQLIAIKNGGKKRKWVGTSNLLCAVYFLIKMQPHAMNNNIDACDYTKGNQDGYH